MEWIRWNSIVVALLCLVVDSSAEAQTQRAPVQSNVPRENAEQYRWRLYRERQAIEDSLPQLVKDSQVNLLRPYRGVRNKELQQRLLWSIVPSNGSFSTPTPRGAHSVFPGGLLPLLKDHRQVTSLEMWGGSLESDLSEIFTIDITPESVADIAELSHLQYLSLKRLDLSRGEGVRFLRSLKHLRELKMWDCDVELHEVVEHLPVCEHLEEFHVRCFPNLEEMLRPSVKPVISQAIAEQLVEKLPNLKRIDFTTTQLYEPRAIAAFANLQHIDQLHIDYPRQKRSHDGRYVMPQQPEHDERHEAEANELGKLMQSRGMIEYRYSSQSRVGSYSLAPSMLYLLKQPVKPSETPPRES